MGRRKLETVTVNAFEKLGDNAAKVLQGYAQRIKALEEKKKAANKEINETYADAKKDGFDTRPFKEVMRRARMEEATRIAFVEEVKKIAEALGQLSLFEYAERQDDSGQSTENDADMEAAA